MNAYNAMKDKLRLPLARCSVMLAILAVLQKTGKNASCARLANFPRQVARGAHNAHNALSVKNIAQGAHPPVGDHAEGANHVIRSF